MMFTKQLMIKSGVYLLTNGNLVDVFDWEDGMYEVTLSGESSFIGTEFEFDYLFSGAEYLGEL